MLWVEVIHLCSPFSGWGPAGPCEWPLILSNCDVNKRTDAKTQGAGWEVTVGRDDSKGQRERLTLSK